MSNEEKSRDSKGRFATGWKGGPGRPRRETELEYSEAFSKALPPAKLALIVGAMIGKAMEGSVSAARLLIEHALGRPTLRLEFGDEHELRVAGQTPDQVYIDRIGELRERLASRLDYEASIRNGESHTTPTEHTAAPTTTLQSAEPVPVIVESLESKVLAAVRHGLSVETIAANFNVSPKRIAEIVKGSKPAHTRR